MNILGKSGDQIGDGPPFGALFTVDGKAILEDGEPVVSDKMDFSSILYAADGSGAIFSLTHFENRPGAAYLTHLFHNTAECILAPTKYEYVNVGGVGISNPCSGSVSPWGTHLGSEEGDPDAAKYEEGMVKGNMSIFAVEEDDGDLAMTNEAEFMRFFGLTVNTAQDALGITVEQWQQYHPYQYGHAWEFKVLDAAGNYEIKKKYALGRAAFELCLVSPDHMTTYCTDDATTSGFYRFDSAEPGDLEAGELSCARATQTSSANGGAFDIEWISLGTTTNATAQLEDLAATLKFSDIFEAAEFVAADGCPAGFTAVQHPSSAIECLKLAKDDEATRRLAAFFETRRYCGMQGGTREFTKMEGITYDKEGGAFYVAISDVKSSMTAGHELDAVTGDHIRLDENRCGCVFLLSTRGGTTLYDITRMEAEICGTYDASAAEELSCAIDNISMPDNIVVMQGYNELLIAEDTSRHEYDYLWSYNLGSKQLTRIAAVPFGAEVTGTSGYHFQDVQQCDYFMLTSQGPKTGPGTVALLSSKSAAMPHIPAQPVAGSRGTMQFSELVDMTTPDFKISHSETVNKNGEVMPLHMTMLGKSGDQIADGPPFGTLYTVDGKKIVDKDGEPVVSDKMDFNSILYAADGSGAIFSLTHFENRPGAAYLTHLSHNTAECVLSPTKYEYVTIADVGISNPCSGSVTPWGTHFGSEEGDPDAAKYEDGMSKGDMSGFAVEVDDGEEEITNAAEFMRFFGLTVNTVEDARAITVDDWKKFHPYQYGHMWEFKVLDAAGNYEIKKKYALGRASFELCLVSPDHMTTYCTDDATNSGFYRFDAASPGDLEAGELSCARVTQTSSANGGAFDIEWISLGTTTDATVQLEQRAATLQFSEIFETAAFDDGCPVDFTAVQLPDADVQCLKLAKDDEETKRLAAFFETRRYCGMQGGTVEFTKMEGITYDNEGGAFYVAISDVKTAMTEGHEYDAATGDHIRLEANRCGCVYKLSTIGGTTLFDITRMEAEICGTYRAAQTASHHTCDLDNISMPDNIVVMQGFNELLIAEDTSRHEFNYLWSYNLGSKELTRIAAVPRGAEVTGTAGYHFQDVQQCDYFMLSNQGPDDGVGAVALLSSKSRTLRLPAVPGSRGTIQFSELQNQTTPDFKISHSETVNKNGEVMRLNLNMLGKSGDRIGDGAPFGTLYTVDGKAILENGEPVVSDKMDFTSILYAADKSGAIFSLTHFENRPGAAYLTHLSHNTAECVLAPTKYEYVTVAGVGISNPCSGSVTPWGTHLGSEEGDPDAAKYEEGMVKQDMSAFAVELEDGEEGITNEAEFMRFFGLTVNTADDARAITVDDWKQYHPYQYGHAWEFKVLDAAGNYEIKKKYALGRAAFELCLVSPDHMTTYCTDDATTSGFYRFDSKSPGDLEAGELSCARATQTSSTNGGAFDISWISLGTTTNATAQLEERAATLKFSDIFEAQPYDDGCPAGFTAVQHPDAAIECLKLVKEDAETRRLAAFFETRRYCGMQGGTREFTKMEGITYDKEGEVFYVAISDVKSSMTADHKLDAVTGDHIRLPENRCGCVFKLSTTGGATLFDITRMEAEICGTYDASQDEEHLTCAIDNISMPDNIVVMQGYNELLIAEDTSRHAYNYLWSYNLGSKELTRIASVPVGAEVTGTSGYHFQDVQECDYFMLTSQGPKKGPGAVALLSSKSATMLRERAPAVPGSRGTLEFSDLMDKSTPDFMISHSETVSKNGDVMPLTLNMLGKSGDRIEDGAPFGTLYTVDGKAILENGEPVVSDKMDFTSILYAADKSGAIFSLTHFENRPGAAYLTHLSHNTAECVLAPTKYEYVTVAGVGISNPCSGSVTPWGTHLGSEEGDPDAAKYEEGMVKQDMSAFAVELEDGEEGITNEAEFMRFFGLTVNTADDARAITVDDWKQYHPYQYGHAWEFKVLDAAGNYEIKKKYALGRAAFELCLVSPDHMTTYCTDDATTSGFYRFDSKSPGDLEAGELSCARATQTSSTNGGAFDISWISLGTTTNATAQLEERAATLKFSDIFEAQAYDDGCPAGFTAVQHPDAAIECLKLVKEDAETRRLAAFFETRRYCGMQGGTREFTKMEGITYDKEGEVFYVAISDVKSSMTADHKLDAVTGDHIRLPENRCGCVFKLSTAGGATLFDITRMEAEICGTYDASQTEEHFTCAIDNISMPDNVVVVQGYNELLIAEDTSRHEYDYLWSYNLGSKELTRIAAVPLGAEVTGTSGYHFQDVQHCDYFMLTNQEPDMGHAAVVLLSSKSRVLRAPAVGGSKGTLTFSQLMDKTTPDFKISHSEYVNKNGELMPLKMNMLGKSGDQIADGPPFGTLYTVDGEKIVDKDGEPVVSDKMDFNSILYAADGSGAIFSLTHFENRPGAAYLTHLSHHTAECVLSPTKYEYVTIADVGISNPCSGSVTPWGTHFGSEEGDPDAAKYEEGMSKGDMSGFAVEVDDGEEEITNAAEFMRFFGLTVNTVEDARAITVDDWKKFHPYQYGHMWEFKVLDAAGNYEIKKKYALGRASFELCLVSPDHMTTYCTDDATNSGFYRFDAASPGDLEAGELSCARVTQTSSANGGAFDIEWISLGTTTDATVQLEQRAATLQFSEIFETAAFDDGCPVDFTAVQLPDADVQCLKLAKDDEETKRLAAFFETRRYCGMQGGTVEFTKMEGITYDNEGGAFYVAISDVKTAMTEGHEYDAATGDHIRLEANRCGCVYKLSTIGGTTLFDITRMEAEICGTYDALQSASEHTCDLDNISMPDNIVVMQGFNELLIAEDTSRHEFNYLWSYNLGSKQLTRIAAVPLGAEVTGTAGYHFQDVQQCDYFMLSNQGPDKAPGAVALLSSKSLVVPEQSSSEFGGSRGVLQFSELVNKTTPDFVISHSETVTKNGEAMPLNLNFLGRSGDQIGAGTPFGTLKTVDGEAILEDGEPVVSDKMDFSSILYAADGSGAIFSLTHFENRPGAAYLTHLFHNTAECVLTPTKYEYVTVEGVGISNPCSGSVSPWGTHLGSEEGDPDAAKYEEGMVNGNMSIFAVEEDDGDLAMTNEAEFMRFFGLTVKTAQDALGITVEQWQQYHPYQYGHAWEFKVLDAAGNYEIKKKYALGRAAFELCLVSPDHMTTYCTDDATTSGFYRFDSAEPGDLEAGELSCARVTQTSSANGGAFDIEWISLGTTTNATAQLEDLAATLKFSDIFETAEFVAADGCPAGFTAVQHPSSAVECLKLAKDDEATRRLAAFFETRRYCGMQGGTREFTKMEGITYDKEGGAFYVAISDVKSSMTAGHEFDAVTGDHIRLDENRCGCVFLLSTRGGKTLYDITRMEAEICGTYDASAAEELSCAIDNISMPDNIVVMQGYNELLIAEDTSRHEYDYLWSYNLGSKKLTRIASVPLGAEVTAECILAPTKYEYVNVGGVGISNPCSGSVSPWGTHLGSEEGDPDAAKYEEGMVKGNMSIFAVEEDDGDLAMTNEAEFMRFFGLTVNTAQDALGITVEQWQQYHPYQYGHAWEFKVLDAAGNYEIKKKYALGRAAFELCLVSPDHMTTYCTDDATTSGFYRFDSAEPGDLEAGELSCARATQTSSANGGAFDIEWISLGTTTNATAQLEDLAATLKFSDIFEAAEFVAADGCPAGFTAVQHPSSAIECLKLAKDDEATRRLAAFFETRRYCGMQGGTREFTKMEGITYDKEGGAFYVAISDVKSSMTAGHELDAVTGDHIRLDENRCGCVFLLSTRGGTTLYDITRMEAEICGTYDASAAEELSCAIDNISMPDNIVVMQGYNELLIAEDTSRHEYDYLWSYNLGSKQLTRIAAVPFGAEVTGTSGYHFQDVQQCDYFMLTSQGPKTGPGTVALLSSKSAAMPHIPAQPVAGSRGTMQFSELVDMTTPDFKISHSETVNKNGEVMPLHMTMLGKSGDQIADGPPFGTLYTVDGKKIVDKDGEPVVSDKMDFNSILYAADGSGAIFSLTHFENRPGAAYLTHLSHNTAECVLSPTKYEYVTIADVGISNPCSGSVTPWGTHFGSEEGDPDAAKYEDGMSKGDMSGFAVEVDDGEEEITNAAEFMRFFGLTVNTVEDARAITVDDWKKFHPYQYGHMWEFKVLDAAGNYEIKKKYALGRASFELCLVSPDHMTTYCTDDATNSGFYRFDAASPGDLEAGELSCARVTQTSSANGGAFDIEWISLGTTTDATVQLEQRAATLQFSEIFETAAFDDGCPVDFTAVQLPDADVQCLKLAKDDEETKRLAAFFETRRYCGMQGGTVEFTKMEGITYDNEGGAFYVAISDVKTAMTEGHEYDAATGDHIRLEANRCGCVYKLSTIGGTTLFDITRMEAEICGTYRAAQTASHHTCDLDNISMPDNIVVMQGFNELLIAEDTSRHEFNYLWSYNLGSKELTRIAAVPRGAEVTGTAGYHFQDVQQCDYFMLSNQGPDDGVGAVALLSSKSRTLRLPAVPGSRGTIQFSELQNQTTPDFKISHSETVNKNGEVMRLNLNMLGKSGDRIGDGAPFGTLYTVDGKAILENGEPVVSDKMDFTSILYAADKSGAIFSLTHFENRPGAAYLTHLSHNTAECVLAPTKYEYVTVAGVGISNPCSGSVTPWGTHLGSEEGDPDAAKYEEGMVKQDMSAFAVELEDGEEGITNEAEFMRFFGLTVNTADDARAITVDDWKQYHPYQYGHAWEFKVLDAAGNYEIKKKYALGRAAFELCLVSPDHMTTYCTDDATTSGFYRFDSKSPGDLEAGELSCARATQTSSTNGGAFDISWISLGTTTNATAQLEERAATLKFSDIFEAQPYDDGCPAGFTAVQHPDAAIECLKLVKEDAETRRLAAFFETRRYCGMQGGTREFTKMEGITYDKEGEVFYVAISDVKSSMTADHKLDAVTGDHIRLPENRCGCVFKLSTTGGATLFDITRMEAEICGTYDASQDEEHLTCAIDNISMPDNIVVMQGYNELLIAEDTSRHAYNYLWSYNLGSKELTRIASVPVGAEVTGTSGYHFQDVQECDYFMLTSQGPKKGPGAVALLSSKSATMLRERAPAVPGSRGTLEFSDLMDKSTPDFMISHSETVSKNGDVMPLTLNMLGKSGDRIEDGAPFGTLYTVDGKAILENGEPVVSDKMDFTSILYAADKSGAIFSLTHFENRPGAAYLTHLSHNTAECVLAPTKYEYVTVAGVGISNPCSGSVTPWGTHLGSEEGDPDAAKYEEGMVKQDMSAFAVELEDGEEGITNEAEFMRFFGLTVNTADDARAITVDDWKQYHPYQYGHAWEFKVLDAAGNYEIKKKYALGRAAFELCLVSPDHMTTYCTDDATTSGFYRFDSKSPGDLEAGELSCARATQTSSTNGGAFDISWISLGTTTNATAQLEERAATLKFSDIFEAQAYDDGCPAGFTAVQHPDAAIECLKLVKEDAETRRLAAFFETRRYCGMQGGTREFTKMEGITYDKEGEVFYVAISDVKSSMTADHKLDAVTGDHIRLPENRCGCVFKLSTAGGATLFDITRMEAEICGTYDASQAKEHLTCAIDNISMPDNIVVMQGYNELLIAEDTSRHEYNYLWSYNLGSKELTRIASVPLGAEVTGTSGYHFQDVQECDYFMLTSQGPKKGPGGC
ncbi:hypothetical protein DIPPA_17957 [Diplonema papillatum]|nr:hypothetical protein DIPPA_17957 [Diplonema papillatum]